LSEGKRNALPAALICIAALTVRFTKLELITTAVNLRPKECWTKPAPIFVIFLNLNKQQTLTVTPIREPKTNWKGYLRKAHKQSFINYLYGTR